MIERVGLIPGVGLVARQGASVVAVLATDERADSLIDCWHSARSDHDRIAALRNAVDGSPLPVPPVAAAHIASDGSVEVVASGGLTVTCAGTNDTNRITGTTGMAHEVFVGGITHIAAAAVGSPETDPRIDLTGGVVPAAGFVIHLATHPSAPLQPVTHDHETASTPVAQSLRIPSLIETSGATPGAGGLFNPPPPHLESIFPANTTSGHSDVSGRVLLINAPDPKTNPLPIATPGESTRTDADRKSVVLGIRCSDGHLNDPDAYFCAQCGVAMVNQTHQLVEGRRPSLGFLVFDDGVTYTVDGQYVVGRAPHDDPRVDEGSMRPLTIDDRARTVSRVHADLQLDGWQVLLTDRNSTNGSFLWDEPSGLWVRLKPHDPVRLTPGAHGSIGQRVFRFESPQQEHL